MDTIYSLLKRAKELKEKSQVDSITPEEVGKLHEDTLAYIASLEQSADGLGIKKVYQSKLAMEADTDPIGTNGKALRYGQLISIYDDAHADSSENGNIYAYQKPGWLLMGKVSDGTGVSIAQEAGDSATKVMSQKAVTENIQNAISDVLNGKILTKVGEISPITSFNPIYDNKGVASTYRKWSSQSFEVPNGIKRIYGKGMCYLFSKDRYLSPIVFLDEQRKYISSMALPTATLELSKGINVPFDISDVPESARFIELSKNVSGVSTCSISFEYEKRGLEDRVFKMEQVGSIKAIVEENKEDIKTIKQTLGLKDGVVDINWCGLFSNVLFIGDSVTGGDTREPLVESGTHNMDYRPYSYPTRIKQLSPMWDVTNAGYSGISSSGWYGRLESKAAQIKNADLIIIELGWNDGLTGDLNTDVVPFGDDYDRYATTAIGYYCKIVAKSKAYNPNAFIILVASAGWKSRREGLQDKVKDVSRLFDIPFIDMNENKYFDITPDGGDVCHFTVQGYYKKAVYMYHAISDCIGANMNEVRKKLYARLQSNRSYTVTGTVTTNGTAPLANVTITITSRNSRKEYSAQTQNDGAFSIKLPNGTYAIGITGYTLSKTSISLGDGGDRDYSNVNFPLNNIVAIKDN